MRREETEGERREKESVRPAYFSDGDSHCGSALEDPLTAAKVCI